MKKQLFKKILWTAGTVFVLLIAVLCVHIYMVTRPKAPDAHTLVMARVDFKQDISATDAGKITEWLYRQKGVDHVLCNPVSGIAIFTFHPVQTKADNIIAALTSDLHYKAARYVPSEEEMKSGCPVASTSFTYRVYHFFSHI